MCTIVFIPTSEQEFILAHNRDESPKRAKALPPQLISVSDREVLSPIDGSKHGSWIFTNNNQTVFLFNGGFEKHKHKPPYDRSRGKIVLETLGYDSHQRFLDDVNLEGVEPFTQVFISHKNDQRQILELIWDGTQKHIRLLEWAPFIRSSSTLYNSSIRFQKERQFEKWLQTNIPQDVLNFMQNTSFEIPTMLKHPLVETISTTIVTLENGESGMAYVDYMD